MVHILVEELRVILGELIYQPEQRLTQVKDLNLFMNMSVFCTLNKLLHN